MFGLNIQEIFLDCLSTHSGEDQTDTFIRVALFFQLSLQTIHFRLGDNPISGGGRPAKQETLWADKHSEASTLAGCG